MLHLKGNTVVITDYENYLKGMKSLLPDNSEFIQLSIDKSKWLNYIVNLEKKLKEHLKTLENNSKISKYEFKSIYPIGTRTGIFHRLPEVHKIVIDNIPKFRLILLAVGTPVYKLAKSPLTVDGYIAKDSFFFTKEVLNFDHNLFMAYLDVELLFTSIPINETIKNAVDDFT